MCLVPHHLNVCLFTNWKVGIPNWHHDKIWLILYVQQHNSLIWLTFTYKVTNAAILLIWDFQQALSWCQCNFITHFNNYLLDLLIVIAVKIFWSFTYGHCMIYFSWCNLLLGACEPCGKLPLSLADHFKTTFISRGWLEITPDPFSL